jgi:hypothetical protein
VKNSGETTGKTNAGASKASQFVTAEAKDKQKKSPVKNG